MNNTEARFTSSDTGQVAYLIWKGLSPDRVEFQEGYPVFLYFHEGDYIKQSQHYWEGDYIPACEMGACVNLVERMIKHRKIDNVQITELTSTLYEYREMYAQEVGAGDFTIGDPGDDCFSIISVDSIEQLLNQD